MVKRMKRCTLSAFSLMAGLGLCACVATNAGNVKEPAHHHDSHFTQHFEKSLFKVAEEGAYSVELVPAQQGFTVGENRFDLIIHDKNDRDVVGAQLTVSTHMVIHGHDGPSAKSIQERGGGLYTVDSLPLPMAGSWEIRVGIDANGVDDRAVFSLMVANGDHHGSHADAADTIDFSSTVVSVSGGLTGSWHSAAPLTLNRFETLTLSLVDRDGKPFSGAKVVVQGGMPEHGHGLPTRPQMREGAQPGLYLVEGLRFSMPGRWQLVFDVQKAGQHDTLKFNLDLK